MYTNPVEHTTLPVSTTFNERINLSKAEACPQPKVYQGYGCCSMFAWDSREPTIRRRISSEDDDGLENIEPEDEKIINVKQVDRYIVDSNYREVLIEDAPNQSRASIPASLSNIEIMMGNQLPQDSIVLSQNNSVTTSPQRSVRSKQVSAYHMFSVSALKMQAHQLIQFIFEAETNRLKRVIT